VGRPVNGKTVDLQLLATSEGELSQIRALVDNMCWTVNDGVISLMKIWWKGIPESGVKAGD
jgi:hypothetical protein